MGSTRDQLYGGPFYSRRLSRNRPSIGPEQAAAVGGKVRRSGGLQEFLKAVVRARRNAFSDASMSAGSVAIGRLAQDARRGLIGRDETPRIARSRRRALRERRSPPPAMHRRESPSAVRRRMNRRCGSRLHPEEIAEIPAQHQACAMHTLPHGCRLDVERLRHLRGGHVFEVAQDECLAIEIGQPGDDVARPAGEHLAIDELVCVATRPAVRPASRCAFRPRRIAAGTRPVIRQDDGPWRAGASARRSSRCDTATC